MKYGVVGDGVGVDRGGTWYLAEGAGSYRFGGIDAQFGWGLAAPYDLPLVGDWNGDGSDSIAMSRDLRANGVLLGQLWLLRNTNNPGGIDLSFGWARPTVWYVE